MDNLKPLNSLSLTGDIAENWRRWKQKWNLYSKASGADKKTQDIQCAIFLHMVGEDALNIYDSFTFAENEVDKIQPLIEKFNNYFSPKKNVTYQRYLFNTCNQNGRPFDSFVVDLKNKAKTCEFYDLEESLIRDRIVCGIDAKEIRERLLRDYELTLDKAINIVRACETSRLQVTDLEGNTSHTDAMYTNKRNFNKKIKLCYYCGTSHGKLCPAYGQRCSSCKKMNHFASVCRSSNKPKQSKVSDVTEDTNDKDNIDINELYIDHVSNTIAKNNELLSEITVNGSSILFKIDTGAQCNIIPAKIFNRIRNKPQLLPSNTNLKPYGGGSIKQLGMCKMTVSYQNKSFDTEFYIVDVENTKPLLGLRSCKDFDILNINTVTTETITDPMLKKYPEVFQGIGLVSGVYTIKLNQNAKPVIHPPRKVPLSILPKLKTTLERLCKAGVISKVEEPTPWVNSMVIVEKKDSSLRICIDPKELNEFIMRDYRSIPSAEEVSSKLNGKMIFSVIDMADCYWHIKLDKESSLLCTFNTPFGRHKFNRLPFGISCASDAAQNMVEQNFGDIEGVLAIHDDLIISASSIKQHDQILERVLQRAKERNIKFNLKKMQLRIPEVKYLGNIVSASGLRPDPQKIKAIFDMPKPLNKHDIQRLLGMINYLRQFIPNLSEITHPIRELLKENIAWHWQSEQDIALENIRNILTNSPVLSFFDTKSPVEIHVDASSHGLGAVLIQNNHPVSYGSRSLTEAEKHYAQIEKELLAIVFGCERFNQFIYGCPITVKTDHKPLEAIFRKPIASAPARVQRFLIRLLKYNISVQFIPGKFMYIPDTLSRAHSSEMPLYDQALEEEACKMIHTVVQNLSVSSTKLQEIKLATQKDRTLQQVQHYIIHGWPMSRKSVPLEMQQYWNIRNELNIAEHIIMKNDQIVIPSKLRQYILDLLHLSHQGIEKTLSRARKTVYWPGITNDINSMVSKCNTCITFRNKLQKQPMTIHSIPSLPWQKVASDLFEYKGKIYIVVIDYYSKFIETSRIKDKSASTVIATLKSIFTRHGIPQELIADNNPYNSIEFLNFAKSYDFKAVFSSPRYPQSNGMSEMAVKIVKTIFKKCEDPCLGLLEYLNTPITGMDYSPTQLLMNRLTRTPLPVNNAALQPKLPSNVTETLIRNKLKQKEYYDRNAKPLPNVHKGETVRIRKDGCWEKSEIVNIAPTPESFNVRTQNGNILRRNRRHLLKTNESSPITIQRPEVILPEQDTQIEANNNSNNVATHEPDSLVQQGDETINSDNTETLTLPRRSTRIRKNLTI